MLEAIEGMDRAGFESMEFFSATMIKKYVREHKENPWRWIREGTRRARNTALRMHGSIRGGLEKKPTAVAKLVVSHLVDNGIRLTRNSNPWNDYSVFKQEVDDLRELGMDAVANIIYSVSPRHTDEYYAQKAREAAALKPWRICFKDVGGMLTPERTRTLVPIVLENIGDIPVEFHAHCNNGLAPLNYLEAIKLGMTTIHTSIPPLANGSAQPSIFNMLRNVRAMGHTVNVDEEALKPVREHFTFVAKRDGLPVGAPRAFDQSVYSHQVPGLHDLQLRAPAPPRGHGGQAAGGAGGSRAGARRVGLSHHGDAAVPVRGHPGGHQRHHGRALQAGHRPVHPVRPGPLGAAGRRVHGPRREGPHPGAATGQGLGELEQPDPSLKEVRTRLGASLSDEELIMRVYAGDEAVDALENAGRPREYLSASQPLVRLINELTRQQEYTQV